MNPDKPTPKKFKIDPAATSRILMVLLVLALVALTMWISGPVPEKDLPTATVATISTLPSNWYVSIPAVTAATVVPSVTPEPTEDQVSTSGVIIGVASVMGIVLVGTLFSIWQSRDKSGKKRK
jgi:hypothetical protein